MTRDFAKKPRPARQSKKAPHKPQVPSWVWLFTGTILGAFIMFLTYLSGVTPTRGAQPSAAQQNPVSKPKTEIPKPRFDFYQLLKESEVVVKEPRRALDSKGAVKPQKAEEYILQVGSFKKSTDADRLRVELILLNLDTYIEKVTVRNGETWHRVLVGPYRSHSKMAHARGILVSNEIKPLLLKRDVKS